MPGDPGTRPRRSATPLVGHAGRPQPARAAPASQSCREGFLSVSPQATEFKGREGAQLEGKGEF